ncbi:hypothetical protein [Arthrobacter sp. UYCo732]|uniref:hypothetical protein n=1 Tax=Arthrobacter sp. UYCo732 TaxID=3156336 RepID=UPI003391574E
MTAAEVTTPSQSEVLQACELALERYTAARRQYTHLYVASHGGSENAEAIAAARQKALDLAARLRQAEDGDPVAVRRELDEERATEEERALTTDRFTIAELHRAAASPPTTWGWKR